jgi:hypothetical protein
MAVSTKKRKRRRRSAPPRPVAAAPAGSGRAKASQQSRRPQKADGPPPAPWGSFPLVEIVIFIGITLLVVGFVVGESRGTIMIATGLALASLGGLELSIREHFAGYRSHTTLLAGLLAVVCLAALFFVAPSSLAPAVRVAIAALVFALAAWGLTAAFRRASGGLAFKVRGFRG